MPSGIKSIVPITESRTTGLMRRIEINGCPLAMPGSVAHVSRRTVTHSGSDFIPFTGNKLARCRKAVFCLKLTTFLSLCFFGRMTWFVLAPCKVSECFR